MKSLFVLMLTGGMIAACEPHILKMPVIVAKDDSVWESNWAKISFFKAFNEGTLNAQNGNFEFPWFRYSYRRPYCFPIPRIAAYYLKMAAREYIKVKERDPDADYYSDDFEEDEGTNFFLKWNNPQASSIKQQFEDGLKENDSSKINVAIAQFKELRKRY